MKRAGTYLSLLAAAGMNLAGSANAAGNIHAPQAKPPQSDSTVIIADSVVDCLTIGDQKLRAYGTSKVSLVCATPKQVYRVSCTFGERKAASICTPLAVSAL